MQVRQRNACDTIGCIASTSLIAFLQQGSRLTRCARCCPAGAAFQHAAMLVTQLIADHRPAPVRAPVPVQQPRDETGLIRPQVIPVYDLRPSLMPATLRTWWRRLRISRRRRLRRPARLATPQGRSVRHSTKLRRLLRLPTRSLTRSSLHLMLGGSGLVAWLLMVPWRLLRLMQRRRHRRRALRCVLQRRLQLNCARLVVRCGGRPWAPP